MPVLFLSLGTGIIYSSSSPICVKIFNSTRSTRQSSITLSSSTPSGNNRDSQTQKLIQQLCVSSIIAVGLGLGSLRSFSSPALACNSPVSPSSISYLQQDTDEVGSPESLDYTGNSNMKEEFERWKSKSYALTVPLRLVALQGSVPPIWIREFLRSQGKRVRFSPGFRRSLADIYQELFNPFVKGKLTPKSAAAADLVTVGDSWLNLAIAEDLLVPIEGAEDEDWFHELSHNWKIYLRRSADGNLDPQGKVWAVPYRWGSMVIAYNKKEFQKHKLAPIKDWSDLWRHELRGKIAMVDSPREVIGATLKYMGASYNSTNIKSQVVGGRHALLQQLKLLFQQVRLFNSQHYLKAFKAGDVWVAVGWSCDVIPVAKTMSNISVVVPHSGASLWADFWAIPNSSKHGATDKIGGRIRGPSPVVRQWIEFCLQSERAIPFNKETSVGASPNAITPKEHKSIEINGRPKLETNMIHNIIPPPEILSKCEFLEPLSQQTLFDYQWLISNLHETRNGSAISDWLKSLSSMAPRTRPAAA